MSGADATILPVWALLRATILATVIARHRAEFYHATVILSARPACIERTIFSQVGYLKKGVPTIVEE